MFLISLTIPLIEALDSYVSSPRSPLSRSVIIEPGVLLKAQMTRQSIERDEIMLHNRIKLL
jgi:hypothetical protein